MSQCPTSGKHSWSLKTQRFWKASLVSVVHAIHSTHSLSSRLSPAQFNLPTLSCGCPMVLASLTSLDLHCYWCFILPIASPGLSSGISTLLHGSMPQQLTVAPSALHLSCLQALHQVGNFLHIAKIWLIVWDEVLVSLTTASVCWPWENTFQKILHKSC